MSITDAAGGAPAATSRTIHVAGRDHTIERVSSAKAARMLAIVRAAGKAVPAIVSKWGEFQREYERTHTIELTRAQALAEYGPRPLVDSDTGELKRDAEGNPVMVPGALAHLTEADWQASGQTYRIPASPSFGETVPAVFDEVMELAEEHVYRLLALALFTNAEVKSLWKSGGLGEAIDERVDDLLCDSYPEELVELAVVVGELVDNQFRNKAAELGDRLGNALRLFGIDPSILTRQTTTEQAQTTEESPIYPTPTPTEESTSSTPGSSPSSSTDTPADTDGGSTPSLTPPPTSSESSTPSSSSEPSPPSETPATPTMEAATA